MMKTRLQLGCIFIISLLFVFVTRAQDDVCLTGTEGMVYHVERGGYLRGSNQYELALFHYQCAYNIDAESLPVAKGLGYVNIYLHRYETALAYFQYAVNLDDQSALNYLNLGWVQFVLTQQREREGVDPEAINGFYNQAIIYYNRALELDPDFEYVYYNRGQVYEAAGEDRLAMDEYTKALENNYEPRYKPLLGIASVLYHQGKKAEAWSYYQQAVSNSDGEFTLEQVLPQEEQEIRANLDALARIPLERFNTQYLPFTIFILIIGGVVGIALVRRIRYYREMEQQDLQSTPIDAPTSAPATVSAPADNTPTAIPALPLPAEATSSTPTRGWMRVVLIVPVLFGGVYAVSRRFIGR